MKTLGLLIFKPGKEYDLQGLSQGVDWHLVGSGHWGQAQEFHISEGCLESLYTAQSQISWFSLQLSFKLPSGLEAVGFLVQE